MSIIMTLRAKRDPSKLEQVASSDPEGMRSMAKAHGLIAPPLGRTAGKVVERPAGMNARIGTFEEWLDSASRLRAAGLA